MVNEKRTDDSKVHLQKYQNESNILSVDQNITHLNLD